ncbi:unnamed protein product [Spirodela intermedia]|uniref:Uncharacterized protein n=1 Tax=Spirodela intermedia TaxID=51605 RepID=A0A7I8JJQ0_SPIIN|nr:unnamed protein product [Spirodela intermedia]CAA6670407.1 unnamed protein product [Spirodela intermedia]
MTLVGDTPPAAEKLSIKTRGGGGGEEAQRSYQVLVGLLIPGAFAMLVSQPPEPVSNMLLFELHAASIILMFCTGIVLIGLSVVPPERTPKLLNKTMNMEIISWLRKWARSVAGVSLLLVFVLRCCLQFPRPSLIHAWYFFIAMVLAVTFPPLLFMWRKYKASSPFCLSISLPLISSPTRALGRLHGLAAESQASDLRRGTTV